MVTTVINNQPVPLEEKAYLEFARRRGFSTATDANGRPLLRETRLFHGFVDAFHNNPGKSKGITEPSYRDEYDVGYNSGMFARLAGGNYFRQSNQRELDELFRKITQETPEG